MTVPIDEKEQHDLQNGEKAEAPAKPSDASDSAKPTATEELSEEDKQIIEVLGMLVQRLQEPDVQLYGPTLEALRTQIKTSTASMTSIPKALKFLRPHYGTLVNIFSAMAEGDNKNLLADILSVLSMAYAPEKHTDVLNYRLLSNSKEPIGSWGHEYVKHIAMELTAVHDSLSLKNLSDEHLVPLVIEAATFFLDHNAEPDTCDLLLGVERLDRIVDMIDGRDYNRICLYLASCLPFEPYPDDQDILNVIHTIFRKVDNFPQAMHIALRLNSPDMIKKDFDECPDPIVKKQLAFMLARQRVNLDVEDEELQRIINNTCLTDHFLKLAKELDILEPKTPEDIYKSHLQDSLRVPPKVDSARQNLAATFVNAFVNAGFCTDKLLDPKEPADKDAKPATASKNWIFKNKDHGLLSAVASIAAIDLWNVDVGLDQLDQYLYSDNVNIKAGAILGIGMIHTGIRNESDPAWALLREYLEDPNPTIKACALIGLSLAYGGSARTDVGETLLPCVSDSSVFVGAMAALALGHVFVGTCNGDVASTILQSMMERDTEQLNSPYARFFGLGLALLYAGKQEASIAIVETLKAIEHPIGKDASILVQMCSYSASGEVLKIQEMMRWCTEKPAEGESKDGAQDEKTEGGAEKEDEEEDKNAFEASKNHLTFAVLGVAMISMSEDIGQEMALRLFGHLMHYGHPNVRKAIPLAIGLLYVSNPKIPVIDTLSKYSHDHDKAVAVNAIFAMGMVGAGTNHAKLAQMLRQLASYYQKDSDCLFIVRIAQGMVHMGKGTLTISPMHSHRMLTSPVGLSGLLSVIIAFTDAQNIILDQTSYLLYYLVATMYPRFLVAVDESLESLPVLVRVGQAVDVVGQAGKPKTITGFQTHNTPVLLTYSERAELATEEYIPVTPILEGFVLMKKNPDWKPDDALLSSN